MSMYEPYREELDWAMQLDSLDDELAWLTEQEPRRDVCDTCGLAASDPQFDLRDVVLALGDSEGAPVNLFWCEDCFLRALAVGEISDLMGFQIAL